MSNQEELAVGKFKLFINLCDTMSAVINELDKYPSWDGEILLYKDATKKKDDLKCVRVQVKSQINSKIVGNILSYSDVKVEDLKNYYQSNNGVLYIVCNVKNKTDINIYYKLLDPYALRVIMKEIEVKDKGKAEPTKTYTLKLEKIDNIDSEDSANKFYKKLCEFVENVKVQSGVINNDFLRYEDFRDNKLFIPEYSFNGDIFDISRPIYGIDKYGVLKVMHPEYRENLNFYVNEKLKIEIGNRVYSAVYKKLTKEIAEYQLNENLILSFDKNNNIYLRFLFNLNSNLYDLIDDYKFISNTKKQAVKIFKDDVIVLEAELEEKVQKKKQDFSSMEYLFELFISSCIDYKITENINFKTFNKQEKQFFCDFLYSFYNKDNRCNILDKMGVEKDTKILILQEYYICIEYDKNNILNLKCESLLSKDLDIFVKMQYNFSIGSCNLILPIWCIINRDVNLNLKIINNYLQKVRADGQKKILEDICTNNKGYNKELMDKQLNLIFLSLIETLFYHYFNNRNQVYLDFIDEILLILVELIKDKQDGDYYVEFILLELYSVMVEKLKGGKEKIINKQLNEIEKEILRINSTDKRVKINVRSHFFAFINAIKENKGEYYKRQKRLSVEEREVMDKLSFAYLIK